jgi:hypothetical protein
MSCTNENSCIVNALGSLTANIRVIAASLYKAKYLFKEVSGRCVRGQACHKMNGYVQVGCVFSKKHLNIRHTVMESNSRVLHVQTASDY